MTGLEKVWDEQHIFFGDIHTGNVGMVDGQWVITDPGHVAVVSR
jgi:streptomycin 6-kinase